MIIFIHHSVLHVRLLLQMLTSLGPESMECTTETSKWLCCLSSLLILSFWPTVVEPMSQHVVCRRLSVVVCDVLYYGKTVHLS